eukprot:gene7517-8314_t
MGASPSISQLPTGDNQCSRREESILPRNASQISQQPRPNVSFDTIFAYLTPIYYTTEPLLDLEKEVVIKTWKEIINNRAAEFWRIKKETPNIPCKSPIQYFGNQFFIRLLEVNPTCKGMFTGGTMSRGETFVKMISFIVDKLEDDDRLARTLETLVNSHCRMGVKAVEFSVFGDVLFFTLKKVLGPEYTPIAHGGWVKVYSKLLTIMLPKVIAIEYKLRDHIVKVAHERQDVVLGKAKGHEGEEEKRPGCPV